MKGIVKSIVNITDLGVLKKHCGIWYEWSTDTAGNKLLKANMNKYVHNLISDYERDFGMIKEKTTPGAPNNTLTKHEGTPIDIEFYRSYLGRVMYYVTKLAPECSNASRELSQHMANPGPIHWEAMDRMIGYLKSKKEHVLYYRKPSELRIIAYVDSNFATNLDTRRSVTGTIMTLGGGSLLQWVSKTQHSVTLSSTEAEYVALAACAQEIRFQQMLLTELVAKQQTLPSVIYEDNTGAIFLVKNKQVGGRTKHIDTRHHFIRELVEKKVIQVTFIRSEKNYADVLTKNVIDRIFTPHAKAMIYGVVSGWREDVGKGEQE